MFKSVVLDKISEEPQETRLGDISFTHMFTMNLFAISSDFKELTYDGFYIPTEVNGESYRFEKPDAHQALYDFDSSRALPETKDPVGILNGVVKASEKDFIAPVPMVFSSGLKQQLSIDTGDNNLVKLSATRLDFVEANVVGLMEKAGTSMFTKRKV